jgi:hypothetical protein
MPPMKRGTDPIAPQHQGLAQPLPPYEWDPITYPRSRPPLMYPGSGPTIPGSPYPPGWPALTWPNGPLPGWPQAYPQIGRPAGRARVMNPLLAFLTGEGDDRAESREAMPPARSGSCQCAKCRNG